MTYRLVLFDLDGTLLRSDRSVSSENLRLVAELTASGIRVGFATGRSPVSIRRFTEIVRPSGPHILFNGAMVWQAGAVFQKNLGREKSLQVLRRARDVHVNVYVGDEIWIAERSEVADAYERKDGVPLVPVGDLVSQIEAHRVEPIKLMFVADRSSIEALEIRLRGEISDAALVRSEPTQLEVLAPGCSKGAALREIERYCAIAPSEVIAFGDDLNDLELLRDSGLGVAMGSGNPAIRAAAKHTIGSNDSDAIARFFAAQLLVQPGRLVSR